MLGIVTELKNVDDPASVVGVIGEFVNLLRGYDPQPSEEYSLGDSAWCGRNCESTGG